MIGINDLHGQLDTTSMVSDKKAGSAPILATYLKEAQAKYEHSLLFHNGDSVGTSDAKALIQKAVAAKAS